MSCESVLSRSFLWNLSPDLFSTVVSVTLVYEQRKPSISLSLPARGRTLSLRMLSRLPPPLSQLGCVTAQLTRYQSSIYRAQACEKKVMGEEWREKECALYY